MLRRTCLEVFASPRDADRGEKESADYSAVPIPFIVLRLRTGRRNLGDSEFGLRLLDLQMVLGNPLPKHMLVDAGDSSTREQWVACLEAEALGEAKQALSVAARGAAAGLGGIAAGGGSMGLAAAVAAKEKAKAASEAALLLTGQREEEK